MALALTMILKRCRLAEVEEAECSRGGAIAFNRIWYTQGSRPSEEIRYAQDYPKLLSHRRRRLRSVVVRLSDYRARRLAYSSCDLLRVSASCAQHSISWLPGPGLALFRRLLDRLSALRANVR